MFLVIISQNATAGSHSQPNLIFYDKCLDYYCTYVFLLRSYTKHFVPRSTFCVMRLKGIRKRIIGIRKHSIEYTQLNIMLRASKNAPDVYTF